MTTETKEEELVEYTFTTPRGGEVTRKVYPEIAKFFADRAAARRTYEEVRRQALRARRRYIWEKEDEFYADPQNQDASFDEYHAALAWDRSEGDAQGQRERDLLRFTGTRHLRDTDKPNSWRTLRQEAEAAGHDLVVWIVDNCLDNEHEAAQILQYTPADPEEFWKAAKDDHEMCTVFDHYYAKAERAGLFKDVDMPASARERQALRAWITRTYGSSYARDLMPRLRNVVRAEREDATKDARAEWDKELLDKYAKAKDMQELLRSLAEQHPVLQTHLNRSDGARRAAETRRTNAAGRGTVDGPSSGNTGVMAMVSETDPDVEPGPFAEGLVGTEVEW